MTVQFETCIWAESWRVSRLNAKYVLLYVAAMLLLAVLPEMLGKAVGNSGLWVAQAIVAAMLAIPSHLAVLRNNPEFDKAASSGMMGFVWRGILIGVLSSVPSLILLLFMARLNFGIVPASFAAAFVWLFVGSAGFAKWGTVLPAVITGHARSFSVAGQRGSFTFSYSFPRLLISFGLLAVVQLAVFLGIAFISDSGGDILRSAGGIDVPLVLAHVASNLIGAFGLVMTAVILSRAFLMAEGKTSLVVE